MRGVRRRPLEKRGLDDPTLLQPNQIQVPINAVTGEVESFKRTCPGDPIYLDLTQLQGLGDEPVICCLGAIFKASNESHA